MSEVSRAELKYLVERQREEMKALNEIGKLLNATNDPQEVIRAVVSYLQQTFPVALCAVLVTERRKLQLIQFATVAPMALAAARRELMAKANEWLRRPLNGEELIETVEDRSADGGQWAQAHISMLRSSHVSPLKVNAQVVGLLSVHSGKDNAFSDEDRHVIDIVADHFGAALRNAFLLDELRRASQLKNDLLMLISHELHTPLTAIKEGTNLILDGALGPTTSDQRDFLKTVTESAGRLETLIEKVLIATKLLTGQMHYTFAEIDLCAVLRDIEEAFRPAAQAKRVTLEFAGLGQPAKLSGDRVQLATSITQIIENAVHATNAGGLITVRIRSSPRDVELQITDTGSGIPAEQLPRIFEQFQFIGGVDDRKTGGLGMGFFIAKGIIDDHHGNIRLESQVGQGTTMTIRLPKIQPVATG